MKTFAQLISDNIHLKNTLMEEFEIEAPVIDRWAQSINTPNPLLQKAIRSFIAERQMKYDVPEELRITRQKLVEEILFKYDPIGLIKMGGTKEEYAIEAENIIRHFILVETVEQMTQVIWSVFIVRFSLKAAGEMDFYKLIAGEVWAVRAIRSQELMITNTVSNIKDKAMSLVGDRAVSLAKDVAQGSLVQLGRLKNIFKKKEEE